MKRLFLLFLLAILSFSYSATSLAQEGENPIITLGPATDGSKVAFEQIRSKKQLAMSDAEGNRLDGYEFQSGTVAVAGLPRRGKIIRGTLDETACAILKQSQGKQVTILVNYRDLNGVSKKGVLVFDVI